MRQAPEGVTVPASHKGLSCDVSTYISVFITVSSCGAIKLCCPCSPPGTNNQGLQAAAGLLASWGPHC
jgi:hypothetical protein